MFFDHRADEIFGSPVILAAFRYHSPRDCKNTAEIFVAGNDDEGSGNPSTCQQNGEQPTFESAFNCHSAFLLIEKTTSRCRTEFCRGCWHSGICRPWRRRTGVIAGIDYRGSFWARRFHDRVDLGKHRDSAWREGRRWSHSRNRGRGMQGAGVDVPRRAPRCKLLGPAGLRVEMPK